MSKLTDNYDDDHESPASIPFKCNPTFKDGSNIYLHGMTSFSTFSLEPILAPNFEIKIRIIKANCGYVSIGVSNKYFDYENRSYLGGDMGPGNWGLASNGSLGVEGSWNTGSSFKDGDIFTLTGNDGIIGYSINEIENSYQYDMKTSDLYLSFTFYYEGDSIEILD